MIAQGEKEHFRIRKNISLGKLVRDKIPGFIAQRQESEVTRKMPNALVKGFLTSKIIEEALEVRQAKTCDQKTIELADLYEVFRALCQAEGLSMSDVVNRAELKKDKAGGFEQGLVLVRAAIIGRDRAAVDVDRSSTQVLARQLSRTSYEIPFSLFGFMQLNQPRSMFFEDFGVRLDIILRADRIELHMSEGSEQLELPLDLAVNPSQPAGGETAA